MAPTIGVAFNPVSSVPLTTPFRRTVETMVATAMAVPMTGTDRLSLRDNRAPPHLVSFWPILILNRLQMAFRKLYLIPVALAAALVPIPAGLIERVYAGVLFPSLQRPVTFVSNLVPIALLDVAVAIALVALTASLVRDWRRLGGRSALWTGAIRLATVVAVIYLLFLATWGLNYRRVPLEQKLDFEASRVNQAGAIRLATLATERLNAGYVAAHARPFRADLLAADFAATQSLLGATRLARPGRPKRSLAGLYFRYAAIDGMTVPVFLEVILNPDLLPVERPSVLAHEWGHLAGYADESEANFLAWVTGVRSADPLAQYSAWLDAYGLAVNALPRAARGTLPPLDAGPRSDLRDIAARYARSSPRVTAAAPRRIRLLSESEPDRRRDRELRRGPAADSWDAV